MATYRGTIAVSTVYISFPDIILAHPRRPTPNGGGRREEGGRLSGFYFWGGRS